MTEESCFIYDVDLDGQPKRYLSPLPNEVVIQLGLPTEAIMGELIGNVEEITTDNFRMNPVFREFLQWVIEKHARLFQDLIAEGKRQKDGIVCVLDLRTPTPGGPVLPEDIIGVFEVKDGELVRFVGSSKYVLVGQNGLTKLNDDIRAKLIDELTVLAQRQDSQQKE